MARETGTVYNPIMEPDANEPTLAELVGVMRSYFGYELLVKYLRDVGVRVSTGQIQYWEKGGGKPDALLAADVRKGLERIAIGMRPRK